MIRDKRRNRGQAIIEFALCFLLFISLIFATFNVCYWILAKAAVRHGVREGVRFAITGQTLNGSQGTPLGQDEVIKRLASFGVLSTWVGSRRLRLSHGYLSSRSSRNRSRVGAFLSMTSSWHSVPNCPNT